MSRIARITAWAVVAAASWYGSRLTVHHDTPVDEALPGIALIVVLVSSVSHFAVLLAVPLLLLAEIAIPSEEIRLLSFGAIVAAALVSAMLLRDRPVEGASRQRFAVPAVVAASVILLRWVPFDGAPQFRELVLLGLALAIVFAAGRTPLAAVVAVATALFTPAAPLRTFAIPLAVLLAATLWRSTPFARLPFRWPSAAALSLLLLFFPWSGVTARALPYFYRASPIAEPRQMIDHALQAGESTTLDVPSEAVALVLSGANVATLRRGTNLGTIEPGGVPLRIGDLSDWGYSRREEFGSARNGLPRDPAGAVHGYGYAAWVDGAGRIALPRGAQTIRVVASPGLPPGSALQVVAFELSRR